jgi:lysophospholipase L1-like esterase
MGALVALLAAACLAVTVAGGAAPARGQSTVQCGTTHWVAAWTADPSGALGGGFADQTLRLVLTPHVGASALRVHITNRFGARPVHFNRASVALRGSGAALVAGSSRPLTFGGRPDVTVAAGGEAISDPVALTFAPFQDLAVSLYLADPTGPATGHLVARERSYVTPQSSGDHTGETAAGAFSGRTTTVDYVDAVDVLAPAQVGATVLFGDSITDGYEDDGSGTAEDQGGIDLNHRFPDYLARRLLAVPGGPASSAVNGGISGNRLTADGQATMTGASGLARVGPDVLGVAGVTDAIVLEGINDIDGLASADQLTAALAQVVARLHAAGVRVELGTIIPHGTGLLGLGNVIPSVYVDSPQNAVRVAVNAWIRSGASGADGVVDFDAALRGQAQPNELDPEYDSGDHAHPNYLGYKRMADAVDLASLGGGSFCAESSRATTKLRVRVLRAAAGRLRLSGSLVGATDCAGMRVIARALHGGRSILERSLTLTAACRFTLSRATRARGRIEVRVGFPGSRTLAPAKAAAVIAVVR